MTKLITDGFPKGDEILLDEVSATYMQDNDCVESSDDPQTLTLKTADGGGGKFFVLSTNRWAFSNVDELFTVINDFINRIK